MEDFSSIWQNFHSHSVSALNEGINDRHNRGGGGGGSTTQTLS